jgi:uncharacterized Zn-binding protein involved in type VI secretion
MPAVTRLGDLSTGHEGYPPTAVTIPNNSTVYANGILVAVQGGSFATHVKPKSPPHVEGADRVITGGSGTVFVEGKPITRIGDDIADGDASAQGSPSVFAG